MFRTQGFAGFVQTLCQQPQLVRLHAEWAERLHTEWAVQSQPPFFYQHPKKKSSPCLSYSVIELLTRRVHVKGLVGKQPEVVERVEGVRVETLVCHRDVARRRQF